MENYLSKTTYIKSVHSNVFNNLIPQPRYQYSCRTIQKHSWDYQYKEEAFMKYLLAQIWIWYEFRVNLNQISYIGCNIWTKASIQIDSPPEKDEQESSPNHNQGQYKKRINIGKQTDQSMLRPTSSRLDRNSCSVTSACCQSRILSLKKDMQSSSIDPTLHKPGFISILWEYLLNKSAREIVNVDEILHTFWLYSRCLGLDIFTHPFYRFRG